MKTPGDWPGWPLKSRGSRSMGTSAQEDTVDDVNPALPEGPLNGNDGMFFMMGNAGLTSSTVGTCQHNVALHKPCVSKEDPGYHCPKTLSL